MELEYPSHCSFNLNLRGKLLLLSICQLADTKWVVWVYNWCNLENLRELFQITLAKSYLASHLTIQRIIIQQLLHLSPSPSIHLHSIPFSRWQVDPRSIFFANCIRVIHLPPAASCPQRWSSAQRLSSARPGEQWRRTPKILGVAVDY